MKNRIILSIMLVFLLVLQGCSSAPEKNPAQTEAGFLENIENIGAKKQSPKKDPGTIRIGITLYSIQNEYTKRFANAAQMQAEEMGVELQFYDGNYDASRQNSQIEDMIRNEVDGILMIPQNSQSCVEGAETASKAGIPTVSVNTRVNSNQVVSHIGSDDVEAGEMVVESVAGALDGTGNVVILEGPIGQSAQIERLKGMKKLLKEYPGLHVIGCKTANWSFLEAKNIMKKWLQTFDRIDAVIAENDDMALGALEALGEAGKDICVVGVDGSEEGLMAVHEGRMYMTVFQNAEEQSRKALEVLLKYIKGEEIEKNYWIPLEEICAE